MLTAEHVSVHLGGKSILSDISFSLSGGEWLMVVGPNGAGKSTLINALSRGVSYTGRVSFEGRDIQSFKPRQLARYLGVLRQGAYGGYGFTVEEVVRLGRYAYSQGLFSHGKGEQEAVEAALLQVGLLDKRDRSLLTLSGGELQRVFLGQAFAQNPRVLLLDEPTNHLDLPYQKQIFDGVKRWLAQGKDRGVICVVQDLSLARLYGDRALLLQEGRLACEGVPGVVLSSEQMNRAYGMDVCGFMKGLLGQWET